MFLKISKHRNWASHLELFPQLCQLIFDFSRSPLRTKLNRVSTTEYGNILDISNNLGILLWITTGIRWSIAHNKIIHLLQPDASPPQNAKAKDPGAQRHKVNASILSFFEKNVEHFVWFRKTNLANTSSGRVMTRREHLGAVLSHLGQPSLPPDRPRIGGTAAKP